jgi:hypothetical protein
VNGSCSTPPGTPGFVSPQAPTEGTAHSAVESVGPEAPSRITRPIDTRSLPEPVMTADRYDGSQEPESSEAER